VSDRPLRIGLNLVYLVRDSGGAGRYARELIRAIHAVEPGSEITAFVSSEVPDDVVEADWARPVEFVRFPVTVTHGPPANFVFTMGAQWGALPWLAARRRLDVIHGLANITPLAAPRVARVVTVLDLIWMRYPQTLDRRATIGMKLTTPPSARLATRVIAISEATKADLVATLGMPPDRIDVTPLGFRLDERVDPEPEAALRARFDLGDGPVVLSVAQKREHKNLGALIRALAALPSQRAVLVLPGSPTPHEAELRTLAEQLGVSDRVRFPGWISNAELEGLYALASVFALPSFEEGFGLPILEAMGRGVPVACSNTSSLPEVAGDAAELFDPGSVSSVTAALDRLLQDERHRTDLIERGRARLAGFTWERTAEATLASYRRAIRQRRGG
jgi:glycosyltransferase involved in cell wall biosynthesis